MTRLMLLLRDLLDCPLPRHQAWLELGRRIEDDGRHESTLIREVPREASSSH